MTKHEFEMLEICKTGYLPLYGRLQDFLQGLSVKDAVALLHGMFLQGDMLVFLGRDRSQVQGAICLRDCPT
jgi:hypothetical protein